jgi:hypothetical protein
MGMWHVLGREKEIDGLGDNLKKIWGDLKNSFLASF